MEQTCKITKRRCHSINIPEELWGNDNWDLFGYCQKFDYYYFYTWNNPLEFCRIFSNMAVKFYDNEEFLSVLELWLNKKIEWIKIYIEDEDKRDCMLKTVQMFYDIFTTKYEIKEHYTKDELTKHCRDLRDKALKYPLNEDEKQWIIENVFSYNPEWDTYFNVKPIEKIIAGKQKQGTLGFYLVYEDGTKTPISYTKIIDKYIKYKKLKKNRNPVSV